MYARLARHPIAHAIVFAAYVGLGRLGLALEALNASVAAVWAPSGFTLAAFVLFGRPIWPAIVLGSFVVRYVTTGDILTAIPIAIGNALAGYAGSSLLNRFVGGTDAFEAPQTIFRFSAIVAATTTIGASVQALATVLSGAARPEEIATIWLLAGLVRLSGSLVFAPALLLWIVAAPGRPRWPALAEAIGLYVMLIWVGLIVFAGLFPSDIKNYPLEFLCVPFFLWAAFRFGRREVATAIAILSGIAVWGTLHGYGPFVRETPNESIVLLQAYTSVMAVMGLVLAASVGEHKLAEAQLHQLATTDPLTGLANYRRLLEVLRAEVTRSARTSRSFAVLFLDMDGLKRINDRYGHLTGSRALCRVAEALRFVSRAIDTPARFGGDEFAIVLPETSYEGGERVLERVSSRLLHDTASPTLSVSGGVAVFPDDGDSPTILLRAADRKLYENKAKTAAARREAKREPQGMSGTLF